MSDSINTDSFVGGGGGEPNEFLQSVPESYREKPYMKGIDSMEKFVEQFDNAQSLIGKKTIGVPNDESSIEDWNQFYNKMGRPESVDAYEFETVELPDAYKRSDEDLKLMKSIFHEAGLTQKQAQQVLKKTDEAVLKYYEANKENMDKMVDERNKQFLAEMDKYFGDEKAQALAVAETMLKQHVPKGMEQLVQGLDDNSMLVLSTVLHNVHKAGKTEDGMSKNVDPVPEVTAEDMREQARKLMMSPEFKDAFHPNHDATKKKIAELYQKIAGAQK